MKFAAQKSQPGARFRETVGGFQVSGFHAFEATTAAATVPGGLISGAVSRVSVLGL